MMPVITTTNLKDGKGKTPIALALARYFSQQGERVLLIDLDPRAESTLELGINPLQAHSLFEAFGHQTDINALIRPTQMANLDLIPADIMLAASERLLRESESATSALQEQLTRLQPGYACIIIDAPARLDTLSLNALRVTDLLLVPIQATPTTHPGLMQLHEALELQPSTEPGARSLLALPYGYATDTLLGRRLLDLIEEHAGIDLSPVSVASAAGLERVQTAEETQQSLAHLFEAIRNRLSELQIPSAPAGGVHRQAGSTPVWKSQQSL